jgi:hypothetical protein
MRSRGSRTVHRKSATGECLSPYVSHRSVCPAHFPGSSRRFPLPGCQSLSPLLRPGGRTARPALVAMPADAEYAQDTRIFRRWLDQWRPAATPCGVSARINAAPHASVAVQRAAQAAKAHARMGNPSDVRRALDRGARLLSEPRDRVAGAPETSTAPSTGHAKHSAPTANPSTASPWSPTSCTTKPVPHCGRAVNSTVATFTGLVTSVVSSSRRASATASDGAAPQCVVAINSAA